jgi:hypothetical protein
VWARTGRIRCGVALCRMMENSWICLSSAGSADAARRILIDNPLRFYGVPAMNEEVGAAARRHRPSSGEATAAAAAIVRRCRGLVRREERPQ